MKQEVFVLPTLFMLILSYFSFLHKISNNSSSTIVLSINSLSSRKTLENSINNGEQPKQFEQYLFGITVTLEYGRHAEHVWEFGGSSCGGQYFHLPDERSVLSFAHILCAQAKGNLPWKGNLLWTFACTNSFSLSLCKLWKTRKRGDLWSNKVVEWLENLSKVRSTVCFVRSRGMALTFPFKYCSTRKTLDHES